MSWLDSYFKSVSRILLNHSVWVGVALSQFAGAWFLLKRGYVEWLSFLMFGVIALFIAFFLSRSRSRRVEAGMEPRGSPRRGSGDEIGARVSDQTMPGDDVLHLHTNRRPNACPHIIGLAERRRER